MSAVSPKAFLNWSSGKDAAMALWFGRQQSNVHIDRLFTTVNRENDRVSMHGLHRSLLEAQAEAIDLPLDVLELDTMPDMEVYNRQLRGRLQRFREAGYCDTVFGDIFLEDLRDYREKLFSGAGIQTHFPLWQRDTRRLLQTFIEANFRAVVVCIDARKLPKSFCGRLIDASFLEDLPPEVDPCGENGEFHTFCFDGPIFNRPVSFEYGELVYKTYPAPKSGDPGQPPEYGYWYSDLKLNTL
jgi:uncharacterized protein (TIGR00290 family)